MGDVTSSQGDTGDIARIPPGDILDRDTVTSPQTQGNAGDVISGDTVMLPPVRGQGGHHLRQLLEETLGPPHSPPGLAEVTSLS